MTTTSDLSFNTGYTHFSDAVAWNMQTIATVHRATNSIEIYLHCQSHNIFTGFKGFTQIYLLDDNKNILWASQPHELGVDGTAVGQSSRQFTWNDPLPPTVAQNATNIAVLQYHDNLVEDFTRFLVGILPNIAGLFFPNLGKDILQKSPTAIILGTVAGLIL